MRKKKISGIIAGICLTAVSAVVIYTGCYQGDGEVRVMINIVRNDLAVQEKVKDKRIIDRFLEFFSTPAYATSAWDNTKADLTLTVSSVAFQDKVYTIPYTATEYSIVLDSGVKATFTATCAGAGYKNWGGHKTVGLAPGEQNIQLNIIPMVYFYMSGTSTVNITWYQANSWVVLHLIIFIDPQMPADLILL